MLRFGTIGSGWITDEYIHGAVDSGLWQLAAVYSRTGSRKSGCPVCAGKVRRKTRDRFRINDFDSAKQTTRRRA